MLQYINRRIKFIKYKIFSLSVNKYSHFRIRYPKKIMSQNICLLDGSFLEGGGQILRNGTSLSCLLGVPVRIDKIRAGRSNPGLRPQHLSGLVLLKDLCQGKLEQGVVGSTDVTFTPYALQSGSYLADTKTAGSVCLLIQSALPCLCFANGATEIILKGGTNAEFAPQIDYFSLVFQPMLEASGLDYSCEIKRRGYYPKGGGEVVLKCNPIKSLKAVSFTERGDVTKITGRAFVAGVLPIKIAQTMSTVASELLREYCPGVDVNIEAVIEPKHLAVGNGTGIIIVAETSTGCRIAGSSLGKKGVPAEQVGRIAADELIENLSHGGCVDQHMQDQLIIFMALASGKSSVKCGPLTDHTKTAIHVAEQMTKARFDVQKLTETTNLIECEGVALVNKHMS